MNITYSPSIWTTYFDAATTNESHHLTIPNRSGNLNKKKLSLEWDTTIPSHFELIISVLDGFNGNVLTSISPPKNGTTATITIDYLRVSDRLRVELKDAQNPSTNPYTQEIHYANGIAQVDLVLMSADGGGSGDLQVDLNGLASNKIYAKLENGGYTVGNANFQLQNYFEYAFYDVVQVRSDLDAGKLLVQILDDLPIVVVDQPI
ncbi:MAG: hypothetical protein AAGI23_10270 [Bacteroidota bacterium]